MERTKIASRALSIAMYRALLVLAASSVLSLAADLRPPATPLIVHDPYFSVWSTADQLTAQPTRHWTGIVQSLDSLVRVDDTVYRLMGTDPRGLPALPQTGHQVLPTHTTYVFTGAGLRLQLVFLNPNLPDDFDLLSRPVTYLTWTVESTDGKAHQVQIYSDAASQLAVNSSDQAVDWSRYRVGELSVLRVGTRSQPVLEKSGDDLRIDWGHLYLTAPPGSKPELAATTRRDAQQSFRNSGHLPAADDLESMQRYAQPQPVLAAAWDLGSISSTPVSRRLLVAYDDEYSVEYFNRRLRPWWRRNGQGVAELLTAAVHDFDTIETRATAFDRKLMEQATAAGGPEYAQLCALAFGQTLAAHKLVADLNGAPLYFSKENFSNGSIDTVDVTYPSSPFFLLFNPTLLEAQIRPICDYAQLPRWRFPFAPHDLGRYPLANGQQYGGGEQTEENQMPVEESGNMLLMVAGLAQRTGNTEFASRYWPLLTRWAEYLKAKGLDPENQLSTDDFAGHLAHNANLSAKAILALAAYGQLAGKLNHPEIASQYTTLARQYVAQWTQMAKEGDHYRLAFDSPNTWSQKYNLIWDKLLNLKLFPAEVVTTELQFYSTHTNRYGLPLDNRKDYTKIDWLAWTAALSPDKAGFQRIFSPAWTFANESESRVPLTDWYDTKTGRQSGFQARSVVGGIFIQMLTAATAPQP